MLQPRAVAGCSETTWGATAARGASHHRSAAQRTAITMGAAAEALPGRKSRNGSREAEEAAAEAAAAEEAAAAAEEAAAEEAAAAAEEEEDEEEEGAAGFLCWLVLLDRPGGVDAAVHAARLQTSRRFHLVLVDRQRAQRKAAVREVIAAAGLQAAVTHLDAPGRGGQWSLPEVWKAAQGTCQKHQPPPPPSDESMVVAVVRQFVWLPRRFVAGSLGFHSRSAHDAPPRPVLLYPIWQYAAPREELADDEALDDAAAAELFSPPLTSAYSARGWQLVRRLQPSHVAPLEGENATGWPEALTAARQWAYDAAGAGSGGIVSSSRPAAVADGHWPAGAWSFPATLTESVGRSLDGRVPSSPGAEAERCLLQQAAFERGGSSKAKRKKGAAGPSKGALTAMLADVSLLCETIESTGWLPTKTWGHDARIDGDAWCS